MPYAYSTADPPASSFEDGYQDEVVDDEGFSAWREPPMSPTALEKARRSFVRGEQDWARMHSGRESFRADQAAQKAEAEAQLHREMYPCQYAPKKRHVWSGPTEAYYQRDGESDDAHRLRKNREAEYVDLFDLRWSAPKCLELHRYLIKQRHWPDANFVPQVKKRVESFRRWQEEHCKPDLPVYPGLKTLHSGYYWADLASVKWLYGTPEWQDYQAALQRSRDKRKKPRKPRKDRSAEKLLRQKVQAAKWLSDNLPAILAATKPEKQIRKRLVIMGLDFEVWLKTHDLTYQDWKTMKDPS